MLEIISPEGISLDLPDDIAIEMEFNNPLFAEDELVGDYSLSFKLGWTDTNVKAFNHVNRIENRQRLGREYEGYTIKYGNSFLKGSLVVVEAPYKNFEVRFKTGVGIFKKDFQQTLGENDFSDFDYSFLSNPNTGIPLSDLYAFLNDENAENTSQFTSWPKWVAFTMYTPEFGAFDKFEDHVNIYYGNFPLPYFDPLGDFNAGTWNAFLTLFPSVRFILEHISKLNNYTLSANIFNLDSELTKLILWTNYVSVITYTPLTDMQTPFNGWKMGLSMPQMQSRKLFWEFCKLFCQALLINENRRTIKILDKSTMLKNRSYIDMTNVVSEEINYLNSDYKGYTIAYKFGNDDDFVNEEFKEFNTENALPSVPTLADLPVGSVGDIRLIEKGNFYVLREPTGWQLYTQNFVAKKFDEGNKRIDLELTPLFMYNGPDLYADRYYPGTPRDFSVPKVKSKAFSFPNFSWDPERLQSTPDSRVVFYRGFANDSNGNPYPYANNDKYDAWGNEVYNNSLRIDDEKGIGKRYGEYTDYIKNAKKVEYFAKLNADHLFNLDELFENMWRINEVNFRAKNIRVTLFKYRIGISKVTAYTAY